MDGQKVLSGVSPDLNDSKISSYFNLNDSRMVYNL